MNEKELNEKIVNLENEFKNQISELKKQFNGKKSGNVMDRVKTFADACSDQNIKTHGDAYKLLKLSRKLLSDTPIEQCDDACLRCMIICLALNEGELLDSSDGNQPKWFPVFYNKSGFGFSNSHTYYDCTLTDVASRLCLKNKKTSDYAGTQFFDEWKEHSIYRK